MEPIEPAQLRERLALEISKPLYLLVVAVFERLGDRAGNRGEKRQLRGDVIREIPAIGAKARPFVQRRHLGGGVAEQFARAALLVKRRIGFERRRGIVAVCGGHRRDVSRSRDDKEVVVGQRQRPGIDRLMIQSSGVEFVTLREVDAEVVRDYVDGSDDIADVQTLRDADELLVRVTVSSGAVVGTFAEYGAVVRSLSADGAESTLVAEVAETADIRTVVEAVTETHPGADLVGQRERERTPETRGQFRSAVQEHVTDRQLEALQLAHFSGFFEWPRESSGDELAERMGVCQSTLLQHLRVGQRKVFETFFDPERATDAERPTRAVLSE